ncbi:MAG: hypothetical protein EB051_04790 [Chlamydiia bacterium]|nr:hypothetical protein [Chlamydiia bacterium]
MIGKKYIVYSAQPTLSFRGSEIYPLLLPISCKKPRRRLIRAARQGYGLKALLINEKDKGMTLPGSRAKILKTKKDLRILNPPQDKISYLPIF